MGFFHACIVISCLTLLVYDYLITLSREVKYVWSAPWTRTPGLPLFYINRYLPFGSHISLVMFGVVTSDARLCSVLFPVSLWLGAIHITVTHGIMYLQTCALWSNQRKIVIPFGILLLIQTTIACVLLGLQLKATSYYDNGDLGPPSPNQGCIITASIFLTRWTFLVVFISETLTIGVIGWKAFDHLRRSNSPWVYQLYQNGIIYLLVILALSMGNVIMPNLTHLPPIYTAILAPIQTTLQTVLCSRVMFIILRQQFNQRLTNASHTVDTSFLSKPGDRLEMGDLSGALTRLYDTTSRNPTATQTTTQQEQVIMSPCTSVANETGGTPRSGLGPGDEHSAATEQAAMGAERQGTRGVSTLIWIA
ncbi:hypothetical protein BKA70DRAFT_1315020 [Coprinopsis sp. MPI-PUGE-AT-0042]|nr:hypothetical protein BKA70DRAFT_1315020 [Coprinopsis sp. MPI-PUGE-AT-0042]